ncbi:MAG: HNH endonuclease [Acidimicrobiia bacterium]|nr:HNH endonuclease [Acidimicrobiia bacterium]
MEAEITELAGHLAAAECRWIRLIGEFDRRNGWAVWGCRSCAHWLNWQCGLSLEAARERLRVARRLGELPLIAAEFAAGRLSYSKVRALTRVATAGDEADLVDFARDAPTAMLERFVRAYRGALARGDDVAVAAYEGRRLTWRTDYDDGSLVVTARLAPEDGAAFLAALGAAREALAGTGDVSAETSSDQRNADALVHLATAQTGAAARRQLVVHADVDLLCADTDTDTAGMRCHIKDGPALPAATAQRLACDTGVVLVVEDAGGHPLDVGRRTRTIPPALRRALEIRDRGCRFPGCSAPAVVCDVHHIKHWLRGGPTSLDNTALLCRLHHYLHHERGYGCEHLAGGELGFTRPDGTPITTTPACATSPPGPGIRERNTTTGTIIDADTITSTWDGKPLDLDYAVACYTN